MSNNEENSTDTRKWSGSKENIQHPQCFLCEFTNENTVAIGYLEWLEKPYSNEEFQIFVENGQELIMKWPSCGTDEPTALAKKICKASWENVPVKILDYGNWMDMRSSQKSLETHGVLKVTKESRHDVYKSSLPFFNCKDTKKPKKALKTANAKETKALKKGTQKRLNDIQNQVTNEICVTKGIVNDNDTINEDEENIKLKKENIQLKKENIQLKKQNVELNKEKSRLERHLHVLKETLNAFEKLHVLLSNLEAAQNIAVQLKENLSSVMPEKNINDEPNTHRQVAIVNESDLNANSQVKNVIPEKYVVTNDEPNIHQQPAIVNASEVNANSQVKNVIPEKYVVINDEPNIHQQAAIVSASEVNANSQVKNIIILDINEDNFDNDVNIDTVCDFDPNEKQPLGDADNASESSSSMTFDTTKFNKCRHRNINELVVDMIGVLFTKKYLQTHSISGATSNFGGGKMQKKKINPEHLQAIADYAHSVFAHISEEDVFKIVKEKIKNKCNNASTKQRNPEKRKQWLQNREMNAHK